MNGNLIVGLVFTMERGREAEAIAHLGAATDLRLGVPQSHKLPAVLGAELGRDEARIHELGRAPGVLGVDVVYAQLDEGDDAEGSDR